MDGVPDVVMMADGHHARQVVQARDSGGRRSRAGVIMRYRG